MIDVKQKKINSNKVAESEKKSGPKGNIFIMKMDSNFFSVILFGFMLLTICIYIFFISSSIFYAIKTSRISYEMEKISHTNYKLLVTDINHPVDLENKISYINKDRELSITLR